MLDIVIVTYRCYKELETCLDSICEKEGRLLIRSCIVVDNSPENGYWGKTRFPGYPDKILENHRNEGFARGVNEGIEMGNAPYILILNPDCIVTKGTIKVAIDYMKENPEIGVLGPKILDIDGKVQGSARAFPSVSTFFFGRSSVFTRLMPENRFVQNNMPCFKKDLPMDESILVDWVSGAAMFVRRDALIEVGLFDERFFMYWEDADLCRRMAVNGWKVVYYPACEITHVAGRSSRQHPLKRELYFHKSALLLARKYDESAVPWRTILAANALCVRMLFRLGVRFLAS